MFMNALDNSEFKDVINNANLVLPESIGIVWALRKFGKEINDRVTGIGLMYKLFELAAVEKLSILKFL